MGDFHFLFFRTFWHQYWNYEWSIAFVTTFYLILFWQGVHDKCRFQCAVAPYYTGGCSSFPFENFCYLWLFNIDSLNIATRFRLTNILACLHEEYILYLRYVGVAVIFIVFFLFKGNKKAKFRKWVRAFIKVGSIISVKREWVVALTYIRGVVGMGSMGSAKPINW